MFGARYRSEYDSYQNLVFCQSNTHIPTMCAAPETPCEQEMTSEIFASTTYSVTLLDEGLAEFAAGTDDSNGDVCCQVPEEEFRERLKYAAGITMFATTSCCPLPSSYKMWKSMPSLRCGISTRCAWLGHIVVIGPGGFQLCSWLQLMRTGLRCRHVFAALITELKRGAEFKGASVHPRWRISSEKWSLASAGLRKIQRGRMWRGGRAWGI